MKSSSVREAMGEEEEEWMVRRVARRQARAMEDVMVERGVVTNCHHHPSPPAPASPP